MKKRLRMALLSFQLTFWPTKAVHYLSSNILGRLRSIFIDCQKMGSARQDSNPRLTGEKLESYLSAVPPAFTAENKIKSTSLLSARHSNFLFGDTAMPAFYLGVLPHFS